MQRVKADTNRQSSGINHVVVQMITGSAANKHNQHN